MKEPFKIRLKNFFSRFRVNVLVLAAIAYFLSLVWLLLFPAISMSSGEVKPRGLFVDENSLLVNSALPKRILYIQSLHADNANSDVDYCNLVAQSTTKCYTLQFTLNGSEQKIIQMIVDSRFSPRSLETTLIVIAHNHDTKRNVHRITSHLTTALRESKWLAKRVVILHMTLDISKTLTSVSHISNKLMRAWIDSHTKYSEHNDSTSTANRITNIGHIRDAYVVDLTLLSTDSDKSQLLSFQSLQLQHSGLNGILPNMDMVSYPLSVLQKDSNSGRGVSMTSEGNTNILSDLYFQLKQQRSKSTNSQFVRTMSRNFMWFIDVYVSKLIPTGYNNRLSGLVSSIYSSITSSGLQMHAQLLDSNIDAVTLRAIPVPTTDTNDNRKTTQKQQPSGTEETLLHALHNCSHFTLFFPVIEELHHSMFHYLLMGTTHFVGITEYGLTSLLMFISIFVLYLHFSAQCRVERITFAVLSVLWDVIPLVLALYLVRACPELIRRFTPLESAENNIIAALVSVYCGSITWLLLTSSNYQSVVSTGVNNRGSLTSTSTTPTPSQKLRLLTLKLPITLEQAAAAAAASGESDTSPTESIDATPRTPYNGEGNNSTTEIVSFEYITVSLLLLLCLHAILFAQHFALAAVIYLTTAPSVLIICRIVSVATSSSSKRRKLSLLNIFMLVLIVLAHSPLGVYTILYAMDRLTGCGDSSSCASLIATISDWIELGSMTFPALIVVNSVVSFMAMRAAIMMISAGTSK